MASPILPQRTYRLSQIPGDITTDNIRNLFPSPVRDTIQFLSLANALDFTAPEKQVSTITFATEPAILASLPFEFGSLLSVFVGHVDDRLSQTWIDAHFHGFTALNNTTNEAEAVDIIALTGLGGKPFASWQCYDGSMWLRDHVPLDIPNARVSLYGYSSEVGNSNSISTLSEMTEAFVLDLLEYRRRKDAGHAIKRSPMILMGHSSGGLLIKDAWCRIAESKDPLFGKTRDSIFGLVFFGTPHRGLDEQVLPGLAGQPSENLIRDTQFGATYLKALNNRFSKATACLSIISCYELRQTPQSVILSDGTLVRSGKGAMNVREDSACLYWARELRLAINENHSMIAKLAKRDGSAYRRVVSALSKLVVASRLKVPDRDLCSAAVGFDDQAVQVSVTNDLRHPERHPSHVKPASDHDSGVKHKCSTPDLQSKAIMPNLPLVSNPSRTLTASPVRVYVHGSWDMFHFGHVRFLERAKRAFPNTCLIVGVIGDEEVRKIGAIAILTSAERAEVVRSCKHVDEVIEDCPAVLNPDFVTPLRIDFFGRSEGWQCGDTADPYKFSALQSKSFEIPMTETISSADIISRIANVRDSLGRYTANMQ